RRGAGAIAAPQGQLSAHRLGEPAGERETEARSLLRAGFGPEPVEGHEQPAEQVSPDPGSGVGDADGRGLAAGIDADPDLPGGMVVADRVGDQVYQHL